MKMDTTKPQKNTKVPSLGTMEKPMEKPSRLKPTSVAVGDLQDPIYGATSTVCTIFFRPYELWGYSLKFGPEK